MKVKKLIAIGLLTVMLLPQAANAQSLSELDKEEAKLTEQSQSISTEVDAALDQVNTKYQQVEEIKTKIAKNETSLAKTNQEIKTTKLSIENRKAVVAKRLKSLQLNQTNQDKLAVLLAADNLQDLLRSIYAMGVMQNAEKEEMQRLSEESIKLKDLQEKEIKTQSDLQANKESLDSETENLNGQITALRQKLSDNKVALEDIANSKVVEKARLQAVKEQKEKAKLAAQKAAEEKAQAAANKAQTQTVAKKTASQDQPATAKKTQPTKTAQASKTATSTKSSAASQKGGKTMSMQSTAYSMAESVNTYFTAMGTDLRKNPRVIAVDPSVIPLGSIVEVEGYGVALASDTGGAIKGNIIDVHFKTVQECVNWGRRQVQVTILQ